MIQVKQLAGHTHWVWTVKYNPCHDQLLLSGGSDSVVNLWRVSSISSAPLLELEDVHDSPDVRSVFIAQAPTHSPTPNQTHSSRIYPHTIPTPE